MVGETRRGGTRRRLLRALAPVLLAAAAAPASANAYEVRITITGAGTVTETTPADLVGSGCTTSANTPTGTLGDTCLAGTPSGAYGAFWEVDYVATPKSGYRFVRWESDGTTRPGVICDRSSPAASTTTYTGTTCKFRTPSDLQTRAVFEDVTPPAMGTVYSPTVMLAGPASFSFSAQADPTFARFECKVDGVVDWHTCASGASYDPAAEGDHRSYIWRVRAVDASGNRSPESARSWTVDKKRPQTTITEGFADGSRNNAASAEFKFDRDEPGTYRCQLDGQPVIENCLSGVTFNNLGDDGSDTPHTFKVWSVDQVGNIEATPKTRTWTTDRQAPTTQLSTPTVEGNAATISFSSPGESEVTYECQITGRASVPCTSPHTFEGLEDGTHTIAVRGTDSLGNTAPYETRQVTVDTTGPVAALNPAAGLIGSTNTNTGNDGPLTTGPSVTGPSSLKLKLDKKWRFSLKGVAVSCPAGCVVKITAKAGKTKLARLAFTGSRQTLRLKLTKKGRALLKRKRKASLKLAFVVTPANGAPVKKTLKVSLRR